MLSAPTLIPWFMQQQVCTCDTSAGMLLRDRGTGRAEAAATGPGRQQEPGIRRQVPRASSKSLISLRSQRWSPGTYRTPAWSSQVSATPPQGERAPSPHPHLTGGTHGHGLTLTVGPGRGTHTGRRLQAAQGLDLPRAEDQDSEAQGRGAPDPQVGSYRILQTERAPSFVRGFQRADGLPGRADGSSCLFLDPPSPVQPGSENAADTRHRVGPGSSQAPTPARQAPHPSTPRPRSCTQVWHGPSICFIFANGSHPFVPVQDTVCARSHTQARRPCPRNRFWSPQFTR